MYHEAKQRKEDAEYTDALSLVLFKHKLWLEGSEYGKKLQIQRADLRGAYLYGANLVGAVLSEADFSFVTLVRARFSNAKMIDSVGISRAMATGDPYPHANEGMPYEAAILTGEGVDEY